MMQLLPRRQSFSVSQDCTKEVSVEVFIGEACRETFFAPLSPFHTKSADHVTMLVGGAKLIKNQADDEPREGGILHSQWSTGCC